MTYRRSDRRPPIGTPVRKHSRPIKGRRWTHGIVAAAPESIKIDHPGVWDRYLSGDIVWVVFADQSASGWWNTDGIAPVSPLRWAWETWRYQRWFQKADQGMLDDRLEDHPNFTDALL